MLAWHKLIKYIYVETATAKGSIHGFNLVGGKTKRKTGFIWVI